MTTTEIECDMCHEMYDPDQEPDPAIMQPGGMWVQEAYDELNLLLSADICGGCWPDVARIAHRFQEVEEATPPGRKHVDAHELLV